MHTWSFRLAIASAIALVPVLAFSQGKSVGCDPSEVEVYRDKFKIICKDKAELAACIKDAGNKVRTDRQNCAYSVQEVFADSGMPLAKASLNCVAKTAAGGFKALAALKNCGVAAQVSVQTLDKAVERMDSCFERALTNHTKRVEICKRE